jgi:hypothetical protein
VSKPKGAPRKFTKEKLDEFINLYLEKNKGKLVRLSASKLASYVTNELKKDAHYQDFTRNKDIKKRIDDFNKSLIERISKVPNAFKIPIYEKMNAKKFLQKNNTQEKLEIALVRLDIIHEKVHDSYGKLQDKYVFQMEKTHRVEAELQKLGKKLHELVDANNEQIKEWKNRLRNSDKKNKILRAKNKILESFLKQHFYETLANYSLYLEAVITSGVVIEHPNMIRAEDYKNGNFDLSDVIKAYNAITSVAEDIEVEDVCLEDDNEDVYSFEDDNDESFEDESEEDNINLDCISNPQQVETVKEEIQLEKRLEEEIFGRFK